MSETKSTIAAKLVAAMGEIDAVTKEGKNETQGYKYVKAADVAQEVRKVLVKHRIGFTFSVVKSEHWSTDRFDRQGTVIGHMNYVQLNVDFSFIDADSGEVCGLSGLGWGADTGEKAPYKAMTGALKYALRMNFIIPDESDPENEKAEVEAEIQRQKAAAKRGEPAHASQEPGMYEQPTPINQFDAQAKASLAKIEAEKRAAAERNAMAEQAGEFHLDGDILTCKIIGIQKKQMGPKTKTPGKEFRSVTFNGRLPNGANFASVFDTELYEPLDAALDHICKLKIGIKGVYVNIEDVMWIEGVGSGIEPFMEPA